MNSEKGLLTILGHDRELLALFGCMVFSAIGLISVAVTACAWYL